MIELVEYIKQAPKTHHTIYGRIPLYFKDELTSKIDIENMTKRVESLLPSFLFKNISMILIGQYDSLIKRGVDSVYDNKIIYLTNKQDSEQDMIDNIVHETGHSLEEIYTESLYEDKLLKKEFITKRIKLYNELSKKYELDEKLFRKIKYTKELDDIMYKKIGYDILTHFTESIFVSPYSATSLREYFSEGFEKFYMNKQEFIMDNCPILYNKIKMLEEIAEK